MAQKSNVEVAYAWQCQTTEEPEYEEILVTNLYFYEKNHLWTPVALSDEKWNIVEEYVVDEFWNVLDGLDSELNDIFFTWKVFDEEIGWFSNKFLNSKSENDLKNNWKLTNRN
jgi:hypothetical protein